MGEGLAPELFFCRWIQGTGGVVVDGDRSVFGGCLNRWRFGGAVKSMKPGRNLVKHPAKKRGGTIFFVEKNIQNLDVCDIYQWFWVVEGLNDREM